MLIFVFVDFSVLLLLLLLLWFLCCYVVKLGKAKKQNKNNKTPQKSGSTSGYFLQDKLWLHVQKLLLFLLGCFVVFPCCSKTLYK